MITLVATGALLNVVEVSTAGTASALFCAPLYQSPVVDCPPSPSFPQSKTRKFTGSWPLAERYIVPSYRAKRKVQEVKTLMREIEKTTNFLAYQVQPSMFPVFAILYFFFKSAAESSLIVAYMVMGILVVFIFLVTFFFLKNFANNVVGGINVSRRRRIEEIFMEATVAGETHDELNYVVINVNLAEVLSEAPKSTIKFFSSPATLSIMSTVTKAIVLDALQKRGAR